MPTAPGGPREVREQRGHAGPIPTADPEAVCQAVQIFDAIALRDLVQGRFQFQPLDLFDPQGFADQICRRIRVCRHRRRKRALGGGCAALEKDARARENAW